MAKGKKKKIAKRLAGAPHSQQHHASDSDDDGNPQNGSSEPGALGDEAPPATKCKHLKQVASSAVLRLAAPSARICDQCVTTSLHRNPKVKQQAKRGAPAKPSSKARLEELWVCLQCGKVNCNTAQDSHALQHVAEKKNHPIALNIKTQRVRCFECREDIVVSDGHFAYPVIHECTKYVKTLLPAGEASGAVDNAAVLASAGANWKASAADIEADKGKKSKHLTSGPLTIGTTQLEGVKGLKNLGNTCFFNSVMQNLIQTIPLRERYVLKKNGDSVDSLAEGPLTMALREFMTQAWLMKEHTFSPSNVFGQVAKKNPRFRGMQQQDSHELLRVLLDGVAAEEKKVINIVKAKIEQDAQSDPATEEEKDPSTTEKEEPDAATASDEAPVNHEKPSKARKSASKMLAELTAAGSVEQIFQGELQSRITCHVCGTRSTVHEPFLDMSLPIPLKYLPEKLKKQLGLTERPRGGAKASSNAIPEGRAYPMRNEESTKTLSRKEKRQLARSQASEAADVQTEAPSKTEGDSENQALPASAATEATIGTEVAAVASIEPPTSEEAQSPSEENSPTTLSMNAAEENIVVISDASDGGAVVASADKPSTDPADANDSIAGAIDLKDDEDPKGSDPDVAQEPDEEPAADNVDGIVLSNDDVGHRDLQDGRTLTAAPVGLSLAACLYAFTEPELLEDDNGFACYECTKRAMIAAGYDTTPLIMQCGSKEEQEALLKPDIGDESQAFRKPKRIPLLKKRATKQFLIHSQPPVLTLHLKRFMQVSEKQFRKIDSSVPFPETLNLNPYLSKEGDLPGKYFYRLYGIVSHSGSMGGGHYVAYTQRRVHPFDPRAPTSTQTTDWHYFSDTHVSNITFSEAMRQEAYLLFYERVDIPGEEQEPTEAAQSSPAPPVPAADDLSKPMPVVSEVPDESNDTNATPSSESEPESTAEPV